MAVFAISDLHLAFGVNKPMDIFGGRWEGYMEKIKIYWEQTVDICDTVVIPGDISWAMYLTEVFADMDFINKLPGKKLISKGNHDYWWATLTKLNEFLKDNYFETIEILHNNSYSVDNMTICGTRGWICPGDDGFSAEDEKIYQREVQRLELSLKAAKGQEDLVVALHYPPFSFKNGTSGFVELMEKYGAKYCIYGHLHGEGRRHGFEGERNGIRYKLISSDHLGFKPIRIDQI